MPFEPPPSMWDLPDPDSVADDLIGVGADLEAGTLLAAYRRGLFPMPLRKMLGWWSPEQRGILPLENLRVSKSLARSCKRYEVRIDTAFEDVVAGCADPTRPHGWISHDIERAYARLFRLGWAHSVEAWCDGELAGGLYGIAVGGLFAGESMFHRRTDASKVALVALVEALRADGEKRRLLDVQWVTPHLASLGAVEVPRREYLRRLDAALAAPLPEVFDDDRAAASQSASPPVPPG